MNLAEISVTIPQQEGEVMNTLPAITPEKTEQGKIPKSKAITQVNGNSLFSKLILNFVQNNGTEIENKKSISNVKNTDLPNKQMPLDTLMIDIIDLHEVIPTEQVVQENASTVTLPLATLLQIAVQAKKTTGNEVILPTEIKGLQSILQQEEVLNTFKSSSSIKELIQAANQYNIKVEDFSFAIEETIPIPDKILSSIACTEQETVSKNTMPKSEEILKTLLNQVKQTTKEDIPTAHPSNTQTTMPTNSKQEISSVLQTLFQSQLSQDEAPIDTRRDSAQNIAPVMKKTSDQISSDNHKTNTSSEMIDTVKKSNLTPSQNHEKTVQMASHSNEVSQTLKQTQAMTNEPRQSTHKTVPTEQQTITAAQVKANFSNHTQNATPQPNNERQPSSVQNRNTEVEQPLMQVKKEVMENPKNSTDIQLSQEISTTGAPEADTAASANESDHVTLQNRTMQPNDIKTDALTQKIRENQNISKTFETFAREFKEKVESYKPPLMKITMQLTPQNLGEVEVTLLNRGQNLQININSNPNTIALFAQNQAEFKNALVNMGYTGLQMNFGQSSQNPQQQNQQKFSYKNSYEYADFDELEESLSQIELVIPKYI